METANQTSREIPDRAKGSPASEPLLPLLPYQARLFASLSRFTWSCWGRQTGKSFTLTLRRVVRGMYRRRTQLFLSAGMRQCRELLIKARQHCQAIGMAASIDDTPATIGRQFGAGQLVLPGGARVIALPARPETIRGFSGDVLLDEFAMHGNDREIWAAIFPTVLRSNGELDIASTPKGKSNLFYELGRNEMFDRATVTLADAIDQGLNADMAVLRKAMGDEELFRQEFLCEFLDEATAFLPHHIIAACEDESVARAADWASLRESTGDVYAGVDVARKRDLTVIWLWQRQDSPAGEESRQQTRAQTWHLRCVGVIELAGAPFAQQQDTLRRVLDLRCVRRCCIDATGMGWPIAEWAQETFGTGRVEPVTFTAGLKGQIASQLRRLAEEGRLRIPAGEEDIRNDWHSIRRSTNATGGLRLDAARGDDGHADRFWAAALGVCAAESGPTGPVEYSGSGHLRFARPGAW